MNKSEKLIVVVLGLILAGWIWHSFSEQKKNAEVQAQQAAKVKDAKVGGDSGNSSGSRSSSESGDSSASRSPSDTKEKPVAPQPAAPRAPERLVALTNGQVELTFSSHGAAIVKAKMLQYAERPGAIADDNPPVVFDLSARPALALDIGGRGATALPGEGGYAGLPDADYVVAEQTADMVVFSNNWVRRTITLKPDYKIEVSEAFAAGCPRDVASSLSLGAMSLGASKNDILSIDSWLVADEKGKPRVEHHGDEGVLKSYLAGGMGGCGGSRDAAGVPATTSVNVPGARTWLAVKNRFFVTALVGLTGDAGFAATIDRDMKRQDYVPKSVSAAMKFTSLPETRSYTLYLGPKKQDLLWDLGLKDVMEFGMWRWLCYPMVKVLNVFNSMIPNYGVAIILLTILVRILFWPLTHKSTVGMRKMQEIQPLMKEIQKKYKDNPQRMQQETWQLYRDHKVNPLSSCLPMLIQIPVFIALFNVLRSTVELRYAPFLWIADLSEPEALGATSWFPFFGGLNILPILMAGTMALQSALTPSTGDAKQQRMMMVMMPIMMLVMFYNFPSALSLYWTLSQVFSIVQMWWIRKKYTPAPAAKDGVVVPDAVEMPMTRQMRRHGKAGQ